MDDKIKKHCQPVCSDVIDHKKVNDEDGHVRDFANLPFPPSDGTEGHSKFYSKDPFTLSDDDSETEYKNFEKENIEGDVKKRIKNDHVLENEGHVEEKNEVESSKDISDDDESYDINNNLKMFSKNFESNDDDEVDAFPETKKLVQVYGHEIKRIPYSDSESDDELDFPEIDDSELIRKLEETAAKSKSTKVEFTFVRNLPYNPIQPSKVLKRNFIDQECSSKSNIINQDIPSASNAKRNREDGFKSNCEIPKKKMRYNSPEIDCACDPVIDLQNKEKPVLAMLNDGHDTFMNYSYKETPQYKSKDILPEEPFLHTEECLNNDPTWVSYRMRKQENANSNKSDILEELNDDFSSEDQLSTLYDFGKFEGGIFWDFPKEEIVAVNKLKQRELIDQNVIKDKKTNTSSEEEGSISNEILTGKNLHDLNVGMKERNFSFSSLSNEDFSNVKSFENKPLPDCVFFDNEDSSLSVTGNCSTTPNSVELLARRSSDILRDEAEQKNKNNFFSEFITLSSSSNDSFTGEEKDSDFSGQNYNVPAIVLNKQNNDGESMDNKTYIERLSERFIVPKENKGKKT